MSVDLIVEDPRWDEVDLGRLADRAVAGALTHLGLAGEVALLACDDARIALLNADFRAKPVPTNVLSWPSEARAPQAPGQPPPPPEDAELGDIAVAYDTCAREAAETGKDMADHVTHLIVHGTLHLLGYDHIDDRDATLMERLEVEILGKLGISDPYGREGA